MKKLFLLLVAVLTIGLAASAQTRTVTGTVLSQEDGEPLIGASVIPQGETRGVQTDLDGNFSIQVRPNVTSLTFSYVGMQPQTVKIPADGKMKVYMVSSSNGLDEVIVVAYGTTTKAAYTGSAAVVNASQLEDALVANVTNMFSGKMAGVQTLSSNGQPGTSATVLIRGVGSINAGSSPLWVVNGIPYDGDISAIPATDIESITVLKDAASTALYGARGANGVILVTTKRGKTGDAKVSVDMRWGSNSRAIPQYNVITDQRQFLETAYQCLNMTEQFFNGKTPEEAHLLANKNIWTKLGGYQTWTIPDGQLPFGSNGKFNPAATPGYVLDNRYYLIADDWMKESLIHGLRQEYNLSISGGNDKINYYISGSYLEDEGIIKASHFNRLSTRTAIDYQAKPWLKVGTNLAYIYTNSAYPDDQTAATSSSNVFHLLNVMGPIFPMYVRNADGSIMMNKNYNRPIYDYGDGADYGNGRMLVSRPVMLLANPVSQNLYNTNDYLADIFDGKWYATLTPFKGFSATQTVSYYVDNTRTHQVLNGLYGQFTSLGGQAIQEADRYRSLSTQSLVHYNFTVADVHDFDITAAYETQEYQQEYVYGLKSNLYNPNNFTVSNAIDNPNAGGAQLTVAHIGWLGKFNYAYANKYYFMASIRRDGSSKFAPDKRWGTFWSASVAADLKQENFLRNVTWIDLLKVKASFGQNGNDAIGTNGTAYLDLFTMKGSDGVFSDASLAYKGNPNITWETTNNFNAGVDFAFWNGRVQGSVEYYSRQTKDMLFNIPVAPSVGYSSMPMNVGSMRNNGLELDLSVDVVRTRDINWSVNANITTQANKILRLDPSIVDADGYHWINTYRFYKEGESMYQMTLPQYAGVDDKTGDALYWSLRDKVVDGDIVWDYDKPILDAEGQPVLDAEGNPTYQAEQEEYKTNNWYEARVKNMKETGSLLPKAYGGFGTDLQIYGFDLSLSFAYQIGGRIIDSSYQGFMSPGDYAFGQAWHQDILRAWTPENTITDVPRLYTSSETPYADATSDRFLISSNYLSLNNVTIGYTLPKNLVRKAALANVRVYASAENVWLWSKRQGMDPRQGFTGSSNDTYSPIRAICGGIKVEF